MRRTLLRRTLPTLTSWWGLIIILALLLVAPGRAAHSQNPVPQTHTVKTGDTLWGLAQQYFGDPFLWPEIYRLNTLVVEDPHWIYPGEVLRLAGSDAVSAVPSTDTPTPSQAGNPGAAPSQVADAGAPAPVEGVAAAPATGMVQAPTPSDMAQAPLEAPAQPEVTPVAPEQEPEADNTTPLFPRAGSSIIREATISIKETYRPLRRSEFYSSGFLSDGRNLPFGQLLGPVTPTQIHSTGTFSTMHLFGKIAVTAPSGASYQVGDTLLLVDVDRVIPGYGQVIMPEGLARVLDVSRKENVAEVIAEFGPIRPGGFTLSAEKFVSGGGARAVPISAGVEGQVIESRDRRELMEPQSILFIDKGKSNGVSVGDIFEVRRVPSTRENGPSTVPETMATLQVVHVTDHTASAIVLTVTSPKIPRGTQVRQVAKLPS